MALIEVDHEVLRKAADAAKNFCDNMDSKMKSADYSVSKMLSGGWQGEDAVEFRNKWSGVYEKGSVSIQFRDSIKNFGECLNACAKEYQNAQADSYSEAYRLPR